MKKQTVSFVNLSDIICLSDDIQNSVEQLLEDAPWSFGDTSFNLVKVESDFIYELNKLLKFSDNSPELNDSIIKTIKDSIPEGVKYINLVG